MKKLILLAVLFALSSAVAEPNPPSTQPGAVTVRDAKEKCKSEGKEGKALLDCIRAQTETK